MLKLEVFRNEMKSIVINSIVLLFSLNVFAQQMPAKTAASKKDAGPQFFVDVSPIFFLGGAYASFGTGIEYNRFLLGVNIIRSNKLNTQFKEDVFVRGSANFDFTNVKSEEIVAKVFLKKSRKGFYAASLINFTEYKATQKVSNQTQKISGTNLDIFIGYRWFPFKKIFFVDGGFGTSRNIANNGANLFLNDNLAFKTTPDFLPFLSIGSRFSFNKK
jgi:hypothetical protein